MSETPEERRRLDALAQQAANDTEFPPEERVFDTTLPTPEQIAAYDARVRSGYYIPGVGAFDTHDGPERGPFTKPATIGIDDKRRDDLPFHIGQSYDGVLAVMQACAHCECIVFHLGVGDFYTALRCANCGREWCQHEG